MKAYILSEKKKLVVIAGILFQTSTNATAPDFMLSPEDQEILPVIEVHECSMDGAATALEIHSNNHGEQYIPNYNGNLNKLFEEASEGRITLSCGCVIEPDGECPHGNRSPLLEMGLV